MCRRGGGEYTECSLRKPHVEGKGEEWSLEVGLGGERPVPKSGICLSLVIDRKSQ